MRLDLCGLGMRSQRRGECIESVWKVSLVRLRLCDDCVGVQGIQGREVHVCLGVGLGGGVRLQGKCVARIVQSSRKNNTLSGTLLFPQNSLILFVIVL